ncbi:InlB B-repeat-containing protein, partial [Candidatus Saccharibacteria bacterium]|nr:InlB B-repeat-containing protein [Candidatus Saccharibacteria bacterium]
GYKLYMNSSYQNPSTSTYTTDLVNQTNTSYTIPTVAADTTKSALSTAAPGTTNANKWAYSLDDTTYSPVPANSVQTQIGSHDTPTAGTKTPVYIGMNVNVEKPSGVYKNQLTFSAVGNPITTDYSLYFLPGTTDPTEVSNLPPTQTASVVAASHTFTIPTLQQYSPTRDGYNFTGYLDESTSTTYQPGDTITVQGDIDYTGSATLTAQWEVAGCPAGANRICYMSNEPSGAGTVSGTAPDQTIVYMTSSTATGSIDETALSGSTAELTLTAPNMTLTGYGFAGWNTAADGSGTKFGPNETVNLATDHPDLQTQLGTGGIMLYAQWVQSTGSMETFSCSSLANVGDVTARTYGENEDANTYAIAKLADGKCWMIENLRNSTNAGTDKGTSWTTTITDRQYNLANVTGSNPSATTSGSTAIQWKSYGGYYSWASAIGDDSAHNTRYMNPDTATESRQGICPSGWRLPRSYAGSATNNPESDFRNLNNELNGSWTSVYTAAASNEWRKYPNNFVFAGYWRSSSSYTRGTVGYYWSSTVNNSGYAYYLSFRSTSVYPTGNLDEYFGSSVRCVAGS